MAAGAQQPNQGDSSTNILWGTAAIFMAVGAIWFVFKNQIVTLYLTIKLYEADLLNWAMGGHFEQLRIGIMKLLISPGAVTLNQMVAVGDAVGNYLRYPYVIILSLLAIVVYFGNSTRVYKNIYNMKNLAKLEAVNWPQISPVINLDLLKVDIDKGPWAMAMTPIQFCKRYRLLEEVRGQRQEGASRRERERVDIVLRRGEANKIFALQLGPLWRGPDKLPMHIKALFAVFAARMNADTKPAQNLLAQLSASSVKKLNFAGVDELLKKHWNTKAVQRVVQSHAYVLTVMASMLVGAREDGVQASADFLWLKPVDRRLWYTLNTVGRQTPFIEVAGIFAHWVAEKEAGYPLHVPVIDEATKALEVALTEVVITTEDVS